MSIKIYKCTSAQVHVRTSVKPIQWGIGTHASMIMDHGI